MLALLPTQRAMCVSPVLCLPNVLPAQFAVRKLRQVLLLLFYFAFLLHYCQHSVLCVSPVLCLLNVLPVKFAVRGLRQVLLLLLFNFAIFIIFTHSH